MMAAKFALLPALDQMSPKTKFGCLVFSKNFDGWAYPFGSFDQDRVWDRVKTIEAGGGTPLGRFIRMGANALLQERKKNYNYGTYRLIVVTDGEASDQNLMDFYARELVNRGITLSVIGVGMKQDHSLKALANQYVAANDAASLNKAVTAFLAEVPDAGIGSGDAEDLYQYLDIFKTDAVTLSVIDAISVTGNEPIGSKP